MVDELFVSLGLDEHEWVEGREFINVQNPPRLEFMPLWTGGREGNSLVPRPLPKSGERAWYTLFAHAPNMPFLSP